MSATEPIIGIVDLPPQTEEPDGSATDYDSEYPGSTPDAPYGFFEDGPNAGQPRKRRPKGSGGGRTNKGTAVGRMPGRSAEQAAALLASANDLFSLVFIAAGMPRSALTLKANNGTFESMARDALAADPKLCTKILSMGATTGKAGLAVAYMRLGMNMYPEMKAEYRESHPKEEVEPYVD